MLNPEQLVALGVDPSIVSQIRQSEFTLARDLIEESVDRNRFGDLGVDPNGEEVVDMLTAPVEPDKPLSALEYGLRVATFVEAAGRLGLELVNPRMQG